MYPAQFISEELRELIVSKTVLIVSVDSKRASSSTNATALKRDWRPRFKRSALSMRSTFGNQLEQKGLDRSIHMLPLLGNRNDC